MKVLSSTALLLVMIAGQASSEEQKCLFAPAQLTEHPACVYVKIKLNPEIPTVSVATTTVDPAAVATLPPLPQPDTAVKEMAKQ